MILRRILLAAKYYVKISSVHCNIFAKIEMDVNEDGDAATVARTQPAPATCSHGQTSDDDSQFNRNWPIEMGLGVFGILVPIHLPDHARKPTPHTANYRQ